MRNKSVLYYIFAALLIAMYLLPQVQIYLNLVQMAILSFLFSAIFIFTKYSVKNFFDIMKWSIPFLIIMFIVAFQFDFKYGLVHPYMQMWNMVFPAILAIDFINNGKKKYNKIFLLYTLLLYCFVGFQTIKQFELHPDIARAMTSGNTDEEFVNEMKKLGVGGFGVAYSSGLVAISSLAVILLFEINKFQKLSLMVLCVFALYFSYNAMFTTLILIVSFSLCILLFNYKQSFSYRTFVILAGIILLLMLPAIFKYMIENNMNNAVGNHFSQLYDEIWGSGYNRASLRTIYRDMCVDKFLNSPFWGNDTTGEMHYLYTHSHSTFWGLAIATGLIGIISYFGTLYKSFKLTMLEGNSYQYRVLYLPIIVFYVLLSYFNPSNALEICLTIFFIIPLMYNSFKLKNNKYGIETLEE